MTSIVAPMAQSPPCARLIDFANPDNNDWLAINQFTVLEGQHHRQPNIVIFVNDLRSRSSI